MTIKRSNVLSDDSDSDDDGDTEMGEADDDGDVEMGDADSGSNSNPNALEFNDPRQGYSGVINMCDYMKVWWAKNDDDKKAWSAHKFVASAYPGKDGRKWINSEEFVGFSTLDCLRILADMRNLPRCFFLHTSTLQ